MSFGALCGTFFPSIAYFWEGFICVLMFFNLFPGEQGMVDEAQKALEEAEELKKVSTWFKIFSFNMLLMVIFDLWSVFFHFLFIFFIKRVG